MKPERTRNLGCLCAIALMLALACNGPVLAADPSLKLEVQLVWGTNDSKSPNPRHKPVEAAVLKKLKELPLKWTNYFEETRKAMEMGPGQSQKVALSEKCALEVKNLGQRQVEISLFGKGEPVVKRTQDLPAGELLVLGGNAPNSTAWLVVLKRME